MNATLNPLVETQVRQKQTYYMKARVLEITPKLKAQSWTSAGSNYLVSGKALKAAAEEETSLHFHSSRAACLYFEAV